MVDLTGGVFFNGAIKEARDLSPRGNKGKGATGGGYGAVVGLARCSGDTPREYSSEERRLE